MSDREAKDALFGAFASVAKALGNGHRAEIVDVLAQGERSVENLAEEINQSVANTSHHLRVLADVGLLRNRRSGNHVYYRLASDRVGELWGALRDVAVEYVAEIEVLTDSYLGDRDGIELINTAELAARLEKGRVVVLDVRPADEYEAGHITGTRSAPLDELPDLVGGLPRSREIVAYCHGPYCVYADDAVRLLHKRGLRARRLDTGFPEWRRAHHPTEAGAQPVGASRHAR